MRKIILFIHSTFNGVVTGDPDKDKTNFMVWITDASIETGSEYLLKTMNTVDTILLGRATYEDLSRKWPSMNDSQLGKKVNNAHKLVVTGDKPLDELRWGEFADPKRLTGSNIEEQIKDLKNGDGGDIIIFGSPTLVRSLTDANLIDEYQIQIHPVVVNIGEYLFNDIKDRKDFQLVKVSALEDGSILVVYKPAK
ncbi:MAG: dihydrofolate reductase family protein [Akkermansiaceae bacterium]|nr:dihydrofolate reductase family protein [Armatimonadota bacterium]